jgi:hypothetical protein
MPDATATINPAATTCQAYRVQNLNRPTIREVSIGRICAGEGLFANRLAETRFQTLRDKRPLPTADDVPCPWARLSSRARRGQTSLPVWSLTPSMVATRSALSANARQSSASASHCIRIAKSRAPLACIRHTSALRRNSALSLEGMRSSPRPDRHP